MPQNVTLREVSDNSRHSVAPLPRMDAGNAVATDGTAIASPVGMANAPRDEKEWIDRAGWPLSLDCILDPDGQYLWESL
jgi:hypothetical protein